MGDNTPISAIRKTRSSLDPEQAATLKQRILPFLEKSNTQETPKILENEHLFSKVINIVAGLEEITAKINVSDEEENKQNFFNDILKKKNLVEKAIFEAEKGLNLLPNVRISEDKEGWFENSQNGNDFDNQTEFNEKKSENWENYYNYWEESKRNDENR